MSKKRQKNARWQQRYNRGQLGKRDAAHHNAVQKFLAQKTREQNLEEAYRLYAEVRSHYPDPTVTPVQCDQMIARIKGATQR